MTIPAGVFVWTETLDPSDIVDFTIDCSGLLQDDETIYTYTLTPGPEAIYYGLMLENPPTYIAGRDTDLKSFKVWLQIADASENSADFKAGVLLPIEVTFYTNSNPRRIRQRTVAVTVIER